jgi:hypothetical protein
MRSRQLFAQMWKTWAGPPQCYFGTRTVGESLGEHHLSAGIWLKRGASVAPGCVQLASLCLRYIQ